jgi:hypothetical protein
LQRHGSELFNTPPPPPTHTHLPLRLGDHDTMEKEGSTDKNNQVILRRWKKERVVWQ